MPLEPPTNDVPEEPTVSGSSGSDPEPRARHRRSRLTRRGRRVLVGGVVVLILIVVSLGIAFELLAHPPGGPGAQVTVEVSQGASFSSVLSTLEARGVISSAFAFELSDVVHGTPSVEPGWYSLPRNSTFQAVRDVLGAGPNTQPVVVPAGFTLREIVERVDSVAGSTYGHGFNEALTNGSVHSPFEPTGTTDLEGLVGAGSYLITPTTSPVALAQQMVARFENQAASVGLTPSTVQRGHDAYSLVTIASVVEKEGYYTFNMPKVATVIDNRLAAGMPLQMNSTVLYALHQDGGTVTSADDAYPSPYNTYLNTGLPPTPICVPSVSALRATMHPPAGAWLYFVVIDRHGDEAFSDTFQEQLANERLAAERGL